MIPGIRNFLFHIHIVHDVECQQSYSGQCLLEYKFMVWCEVIKDLEDEPSPA